MLIGIHHRSDGSLIDSIQQAGKIGANCMQVFLAGADNTNPDILSANDVELVKKELERNKIEKIFVHGTFRSALTGKNPRFLARSRKTMYRELEVCDQIGAEYLVIHPGSAKEHPTSVDDPFGTKIGCQTMVEQLERISEKPFKTKILIENTAYGRATVGGGLEEFAFFREKLKNNPKIGFCFDTAHAFAYGYSMQPFEHFAHLMETTMGFDMLKLVHLNDSDVKLSSRIDKHEAPGLGQIGATTLRNIFNLLAPKGIPMIVELPSAYRGDEKVVVNKIKEWASTIEK